MPEVRSWRFTALEFRTLWESTGRDVLPYPLRHQYATEFRSESLRLRQEAARSLHPRLDDDLLRAVEVLLAPEARVELAGFAGARRDRKLRAHAGVHYQHGAVAVQEPGPGHEHGDVVLTLLPAAEVARTVVDVFPRCGAGRGKQVQATAEELTRHARRSATPGGRHHASSSSNSSDDQPDRYGSARRRPPTVLTTATVGVAERCGQRPPIAGRIEGRPADIAAQPGPVRRHIARPHPNETGPPTITCRRPSGISCQM
ncbi:ESX secretion-associated protein EspG [Nocardia gipuzkoensis]